MNYIEEAKKNFLLKESTLSKYATKSTESIRMNDETRRRISEALKGKNSPNYGKHHSEETRKKMSNAHRGQTLSEERRKHISEALKGKKRKRWRLVNGLREYYV